MCGSSSPAAPSSTTTNTSNIPEYARPYVEAMLGATQKQLFNTRNVDGKTEITGMKAYKPYSTDMNAYFAGFNPMQEKAFGMVSGPEGFAQNIGGYMSPYQQNVTDIQKREAARQSGIAGLQQQAQATQAGAFGGGRDAIMRAERERNLAQQMNDIQAQGSQSAYDKATQQFNTNIGQMATAGNQQQQLEQNKINQAVQNYATGQQWGMQQLSNMNAMLRGLPLQTTSTQSYQAAPSVTSQLAGLGTAAYGASKLAAKGGATKDIKKRKGAGLMDLALSKIA